MNQDIVESVEMLTAACELLEQNPEATARELIALLSAWRSGAIVARSAHDEELETFRALPPGAGVSASFARAVAAGFPRGSNTAFVFACSHFDAMCARRDVERVKS